MFYKCIAILLAILIIKYRSSSKMEVIRKKSTELWPFFALNCGFRSITFEGMKKIHATFTDG